MIKIYKAGRWDNRKNKIDKECDYKLKICWDNLEKLKYTKNKTLCNVKNGTTFYFKVCKNCNEDYIGEKYSNFCSRACCNSGKNNPFFGKRHTEKTKKLISDNHGTRKKEVREKISKSLKGKLKGKNNPFFGKHHTEKTKKILVENHSDGKFALSNNPNWKGGISFKGYCPSWNKKEFKNFIKDRDNNICLNPSCNKTCNRLSIHHIDYNKENCELNNLITICVSCNSIANFNRDFYKNYYKTLLKIRYGYNYE